MEKIKTFLRHYFILTKRLLKKPGFLVILLLVPLIVGAIKIIAASGDGGVVTVALAMQDNEDETAREIVSGILNEESLIRFELCENQNVALSMVENGSADAAWIFAAELEEKIQNFAAHTHKNNSFVAIIQREESIPLQLANEKLNTALYPYITLAVYREALNNSSVNLSELSKEEIDTFYHSVNADGGDLFEFVYMNSPANQGQTSGKESNNFLLSPLRGLLAITLLFSGIAVAMYYMNDEAKGVFDRLPRGTGFSFSLIYHSCAVLTLGAVIIPAIAFSGIAISWWYEIPILITYCIATVGFCMCLRMIIKDIRLFATLAPLLVVATAVLSPIFIMAPDIPIIQYLLPTYYYVMAFSNANFACYMIIYCLAAFILAFILHSLRLNKAK